MQRTVPGVPAIAFPDPALTDGVVALRPWRPADAEARYAGFTDPLCLQFSWPYVEPPTEADVAGAFARNEDERRCGVGINLAVVDAVDQDAIWGAASVYDLLADQDRAGIGYWLAPRARGRGLATRALRLLSGWALEELSIARLELTCAPDNLASQRVAERCGFRREGLLRSHMRFKGGRRDTVVHGLLPGELR